MKILVVEPDNKPYVKEIKGNLREIKKIVGGTLEIIVPFIEEPSICIACDESGREKFLKFNRALKTSTGIVNNIISGTFVVFNTSEERGEDLIDLTDEQIKFYTEKFEEIDPRINKLNAKLDRLKRMKKVIISEPEKEPYVKEIIFDRENVQKIIGINPTQFGDVARDGMVILFNNIDHNFTGVFANALTKEDKINFNLWHDTFIACKTSEDGSGIVSFEDEDIEKYIEDVKRVRNFALMKFFEGKPIPLL